MKIRLTAVIVLLLVAKSCFAGEVLVAVANNFYGPAQKLASDFYQQTGNTVELSTGSTGQLYTQIVNGAPYQVFLAADKARPQKLADQHLASKTFTYAKGNLVLWTSESILLDDQLTLLTQETIKHVALADPKLAPYGVAAQQVMEKLEVYNKLTDKLVFAKGLNAVYQYIVTGNVDVGFVAKSQVFTDGEYADGTYWEVPSNLYSPINQDAALLAKGETNPVAVEFVRYLTSERAKKMITQFGYQ